MTTIAYDGQTLAADKLCIYDNVKNTVTKIFRMPTGELVGAAGDVTFSLALIEWVKAGRIKADFPAHARDKDDWQPLLVIELDGTTSFYERTPYPIRNENRCVAYGSGKEYAVAAMHLGKTAREAVEVAIALDCGSGNGIDTLELEALAKQVGEHLESLTDKQWKAWRNIPGTTFTGVQHHRSPYPGDQIGGSDLGGVQSNDWRLSAEPPL